VGNVRVFVVQKPDAHGAPGPVRDYIGQIIPVRLGETGLAYPARLEQVQPAEDGQVLLTFDLVDAEILWNVLTNEHTHAGT